MAADVAKGHRREMTKDEKALFGIEKLNVPRSDIPAVTHVDYSARIQTVHVDTNPRYHALISRFKELTGCPVIVNTSFNVRGEPISSVLGDARSPTMQSVLNLKVKYRESFRPFAPSVLREEVSNWFELDKDSPYMLLVADVTKGHRREMTKDEKALFGIEKLNVPRSDIPAVTHVDYSARIQTVHQETNPRFHALISMFKALTGCPVIVNTSFNVRGEPIVCSPEDAFRCFMGTEIEVLAAGNCFLKKGDQDRALARDYKDAFDLD